MDITRGQKLLLLVGLAAIIAALLVMTLQHVRPPPLPSPDHPAPSVVRQLPSRTIAVDVIGAVNRPGVCTVAEGARVYQAVEAAGGLRADADRSSVNMAKLLTDGEQIVVAVRPPPPLPQEAPVAPAPAAAAAPVPPPPLPVAAAPATPGVVSLSRASKLELEALPDIGPTLAMNILYYRAQHGPFRSVEELVNVPGFGPERLRKLRQYLVP